MRERRALTSAYVNAARERCKHEHERDLLAAPQHDECDEHRDADATSTRRVTAARLRRWSNAEFRHRNRPRGDIVTDRVVRKVLRAVTAIAIDSGDEGRDHAA